MRLKITLCVLLLGLGFSQGAFSQPDSTQLGPSTTVIASPIVFGSGSVDIYADANANSALKYVSPAFFFRRDPVSYSKIKCRKLTGSGNRVGVDVVLLDTAVKKEICSQFSASGLQVYENQLRLLPLSYVTLQAVAYPSVTTYKIGKPGGGGITLPTSYEIEFSCADQQVQDEFYKDLRDGEVNFELTYAFKGRVLNTTAVVAKVKDLQSVDTQNRIQPNGKDIHDPDIRLTIEQVADYAKYAVHSLNIQISIPEGVSLDEVFARALDDFLEQVGERRDIDLLNEENATIYLGKEQFALSQVRSESKKISEAYTQASKNYLDTFREHIDKGENLNESHYDLYTLNETARSSMTGEERSMSGSGNYGLIGGSVGYGDARREQLAESTKQAISEAIKNKDVEKWDKEIRQKVTQQMEAYVNKVCNIEHSWEGQEFKPLRFRVYRISKSKLDSSDELRLGKTTIGAQVYVADIEAPVSSSLHIYGGGPLEVSVPQPGQPPILLAIFHSEDVGYAKNNYTNVLESEDTWITPPYGANFAIIKVKGRRLQGSQKVYTDHHGFFEAKWVVHQGVASLIDVSQKSDDREHGVHGNQTFLVEVPKDIDAIKGIRVRHQPSMAKWQSCDVYVEFYAASL